MPGLTAGVWVLALVLAGGSARAGSFEEGRAAFRKAAELRSRGDPGAEEAFRQAARIWEALAASGGGGSRLQTNIGNANAFAGDLGKAVLAYRRALVLDPGNERARRGLRALRARVGIEDRSASASTGLLHALFFWHDALLPATRKVLFGVLWVLGLSALFLARRRRGLRVPAVLLLAGAAAVFVSLAISDRAAAREADAVLMERTEGRSGDAEFYTPSHSAPLPAGAEIRILERRKGWIHGRLRDGTDTWLPARRVEEVIPPA